MTEPVLVDFCCGRTGGATVGFQRAGFRVIGIDQASGKQYPGDEFIRGDVRDYWHPEFLASVRARATAGSPPCQFDTRLQHLRDAQGNDCRYDDGDNLIGGFRDAMAASGLPYVIENVPGAPLVNPMLLCGSMFKLGVRRHRLFESNVFLYPPGLCDHEGQGRPVGVYGSKADDIPDGGATARTLEEGKAAMGVDWDCSWAGLVEAIPPAFTEWVGGQLMDAVLSWR
jgi:DNA (cytosine-5)-methyltransferase 1